MANTATEDFYYGTTFRQETLSSSTSKKRKVYGLGFPIGKNPNQKGGLFRKASGLALRKQNLRQLLLTELGERVMLPDYGVALRKYLFSPLDEHLFNEIRKDILSSLARYAKFVRVKKLSIFQDSETTPQGGNSLQIILVVQDKDSDALFSVNVERG